MPATKPRVAQQFTLYQRMRLRSASWLVRGLGKGLRRHLGAGRPAFLDIDAVYPSLRSLDRHADEIKREVEALMPRRDDIPRYHEINHSQRRLSEGNPAWRTLFVHVRNAGDAMPNRDLCPRTAALVEKIPGVLEAFFSILEPGKSIAAHHGPHPGYLRYHLGLIVPRDHPPSMRVRDRHHVWREGESLLFDDSLEHEVDNRATDPRVVLIVDVVRPLPWPWSAVNRVALAYLYDKRMSRPMFPAMRLREPSQDGHGAGPRSALMR